MLDAISNTSPLLFVHRIHSMHWLKELFGKVLVPKAVIRELEQGRSRGFDVPDYSAFAWLEVVDPVTLASSFLPWQNKLNND